MRTKRNESLNRATALKIMAIIAAVLIVFIVAMIFVIMAVNRHSARTAARSHLAIFENYLYFSNDFNNLVTLTDGDLRITVITLDGTVLADTLSPNVEELDSRANRREFIDALENGEGWHIRHSETFRVNFLYMARVVSTDNGDIVLRVATPVANINNYLWPLVGIMAGLFAVTMLVVFLMSPKLTKSVIAPIFMIKKRLENISERETAPLLITRHDEINKVLIEIDELSEKLNNSLEQTSEQKQKLNLILENIDQGIIALDNNGVIISSNKKAEEFFCFEYKEPVKIETVIRNISVLDNISQALQKNTLIFYDHTRATGEVFQVRFLPVALEKISLIIAVQNVTELRKIAVEKQEFFANAGHELNTPLASVVGYSEMLIKTKKYNKDFIETIHREALRMKLLIEDMLKISELEENKAIVDERISLDKIIKNVVEAVALKAKAKNITIEQKLESASIFASEEKITEVVSNLVDNSIKYSNDGASIKVSLKQTPTTVVLSVIDTGIGIPQNELPRVFERFYRVDKARTKQEGGTGLGLAIVKHICNHYNAQVKIESKQNLGTKITVIFNRG